ncbi:hypothetical protein F5Y13DRAFT_160962 [Hypoxylon sp. FL1857]|nr:hypothetical protein F5Y13DRAFT_160962 [Hypoxylon sp. FL1857]
MGSKRKFSEFHAEPHSKGATRDDISGYPPRKLNKKNPKKAKAKPDNLNWLKKRVRTIERRFKAGHNMPANVQNELERELAHHQQKIEEATDDKKRKMMIKKYHMVRFFERKKADRLAKQIKSQLKTATDEKEIEKLNADLHRAEIDSIYTRYFPYRERYISLYPVASLGSSGEKKEDASTAAQALHAERPPLWGEIEKASGKGIPALIEIRERKSEKESRGKRSAKQSSKDSISTKTKDAETKSSTKSESTNTRQGKGRKKRDEPCESSDSSDSEGGFFEED